MIDGILHSAVNFSASKQIICFPVHGDHVLFQMGQFYYAAKAFDALEKLDPGSNYWEGKRGACVGIFQLILANKEPKETLKEVLALLRNSGNPQVEYIIRILRKWAKDNRVLLS
ncbi:Intraflagellar transport protein 56 [Xenotaenia resolanae]|uniref:Intraflagellar transport protein 56 n=1 Tax=Xenotaenia resolanae TaxID=208358 RepID=A0ABV0W6C5_9TELE